MKMQQNKEKKDAFPRICPSERWHAAVLSVRPSRIRLSQATNKNRIYTSDCLKSILFSFAIKYNEEICTWEMGKP